jgi:hypothetical protein
MRVTLTSVTAKWDIPSKDETEKNRGAALETGQSLLEVPHLTSLPLVSSHPLFESRPSLDGLRDVRDAVKYVK